MNEPLLHEPDDVGAADIPPLKPHLIVLVGATGDLARRKLLPGLLHLIRSGLLPDCRIVGAAMDDIGDDEFREVVRAACDGFARTPLSPLEWSALSDRITYASLAHGSSDLVARVRDAEAALGGVPGRLHYLSIPPSAAPSVVRMLGDTGLADRARVIMEKPFGTDLPSARALNALVAEVFDDEQVFRIDHFLGKEAAQNILAFRFANGLFEPIWNRQHIDHVQIDVAESLSIEGRGAFYEGTGAFRDMVVTHLFHVLAFVAMEPPTALTPESIGEEKNKVFRSLRPLEVDSVVRGQYEGYRDDPTVADDSGTETFVALRCEIDNWRWAGVPFYLRTGKSMAEGMRIVSIAFKEPPRSMFPAGAGLDSAGPDHLTFDLAEASRLSLSFYGKRPGPGMRLTKQSMQFSITEDESHGDVLEAYERLIYDAMSGDRTLFTSARAVERLWEVSAPLLHDPPEILPYPQGSWGPPAMEELIRPRTWRLPFRRGWRGPH